CRFLPARFAERKACLNRSRKTNTYGNQDQGFGPMTNQAPPRQFGVTPAESPGSALQNLDRRSREIFRQIVETYLGTGEPVGSRNISRMLPVALSPASVRNVMADLESLGLIYAPHT